MNTGEIVSITKIDKSKSPVSEPGDWETWDLGVANAHSLPISYQVLGVLLAPVKVGGRIHRDAPALAAMDDISWCRAAREKHATLRWNQEACENADSNAEAKPPRVTRSQRGIINALNDYWEILNDSRPVADVQAREKALIVAPTGCGKSFCIREFARLKNLPAFETEPNIWIPQGARYDRPTISELHTFVVTNDCGIIFIDEVDKLLAECDYMIAVRQEIYSLLDGVRRGYSIFTDAEKEKVRRRFLLVGAGTWQSLFAARSVGFQQHREAVKIARLWHLASGRNALEHHGEILDLCSVAPPNGLRVNIAQETPRVAGSALPAIAWIEYYDIDYRASDICKESRAIPPQSDSPEAFMGQAQRSFAYHKLCNCNDWTEPLRHIRYCIIAAALHSPAVAEILIRYAIGLTPADCAERSSLFEQYPGKPASQPT